jgi:hypothetical protein
VSRFLTLSFLSLFFVACTADEPTQAGPAESGQAPSGDNPTGAAGADRPEQGGAASNPSGQGAYDDSDCNLQTVLDPNKPGAPGHLIESPRNPNGDSELAVLMRRFVDQLKENRLRVKNGESVEKLFPTHRTMRCAWPTNPKERNEGYDGRAQSYLATVRAFDEAPDKETYNAVVNACIQCHQINCGGVIGFIETLRWE